MEKSYKCETCVHGKVCQMRETLMNLPKSKAVEKGITECKFYELDGRINAIR
jgi:hypothetical protein